MKFTFTTKEEYLAYCSEWKKKYAQLSKSIRIYKLFGKETSRIWNKAMRIAGATHAYDERILKAFDIKKELWANRSDYLKQMEAFINSSEFIKGGSELANQMCEELKEAKQEAQRQYLASKAQKETAVLM